MTNLHKDYPEPFLLEPTKLRRLVDRAHERISDHPGVSPRDTFEVYLTGNRREETTSLEHVLALDNSRRQRIQRLLYTCAGTTSAAAQLGHEVVIDFGREQRDSSDRKAKVIAVSVRSVQAGWANRTLSELEEQIERTWLQYTGHQAALVSILIGVLFLLLFQVLSITTPLNSSFWLADADLDRVEVMLRQRPMLTDADVRDIHTMQMRNLLAARAPTIITTDRIKRALVVAVPFCVVVVCAVVLLTTCYPRAVFLWGDEVDRYTSTVQRRKAIWSVIAAVTIVGVASGLFFENVSSWLGQ